MSMDRMPEGLPPSSALPRHGDGLGSDAADAAARRALRVQMLATEHWSLLATRSLSWNEAFARAGMFLSVRSGAGVALALVAQADDFGPGFSTFALLLLPVVLFVGVATYVRLLEINNEDYVWVRGMNRLRGAYLEIDPGLAPHFITGTTEDAVGVFKTFGSSEEQLQHSDWFHGFVTTPATIGFVNSMVAAALAAIIVVQLDMAMAPTAIIGIIAFFATAVALGFYAFRTQTMARITPEAERSLAESHSTDEPHR
jgi:hypothetical protein